MNDPIDFGAVGLAVLRWISSPTTTILLSLAYLAWVLSRIVEHATTPRKDRTDER